MANTQGRNARLARLHNRALLLKLIIQSGSISRKDLAARMGLTQAAITKISDDLIKQGVVREDRSAGTAGSPGRRPIPLSVETENFRILTVCLGRRLVRCYLTDAKAGILQSDESPSQPVLRDPKKIQESLLRHVVGLLNRWGIDRKEVFAVALGAPGPLRAARGTGAHGKSRRHANPYAWDDLSGYLTKRLGRPVFAENDANLMALGEQWFGCGRGCSHFVLYAVGEGIGAAAVIDGMLYRGHENVVAEIGHTTVQLAGERCSCGNYGCLELYAGFTHLRDTFRRLHPAGAPRSYYADLRELFDLYLKKEPLCVELVDNHAKLISVGAVTLVNMFSPEKIVVASYDGDAIDLDPFIADMRKGVRQRAFSAVVDEVAVEKSSLGGALFASGGVALVLGELFDGLSAGDGSGTTADR